MDNTDKTIITTEPPGVDGQGRVDVSRYPDIVGALLELDKILNVLSQRLAELGVKGDLSIHLESGWKIEKGGG